MAITGKFQADFSSFVAETQKATTALKSVESEAGKAATELNTMSTTATRSVGTVAKELVLAQKEVTELQKLIRQNADKPGFIAGLEAELDSNIPKISALKRELSDLKKPIEDVATVTKTTSSAISGFGEQIASMATGFITAQAAIGVVTGAFHTLTGFVADSVKAYAEAESAQKKLTTALQAQGTSTPAIIAQYGDLATQFQHTTAFSDDLITSMEGLLVQVGNVMPNAMQAALKASTDLAAGLGIDLETATTIVAKAAAGHTETLGRYGIKVDQAKLASEGFSAVLEAINRQFGGQAAAQLDTYAGRVENLKNQWNNLQEVFGKLIVTDPVLSAALRNLSEGIGATADNAGKANPSMARFIELLGILPGSGAAIAYLEGLAAQANETAAALERLKAAQLSPEVSHLQPFAPAVSHGPDTGFVEGLRQGSDAMDELHAAFKRFKDEKAEEELKRQQAEWKAWAKSVDDATVASNLGVFTLNRYHKELDDVRPSLDAVRDQFENWIAPLDSVEVGIKLTSDQLEGLQRAGRFAEVAMASLNQQLLKLPNVHSSLEGVDTAVHKTGDGLNELARGFSQMAQVSDGALSEVARTIGTVITGLDTAIKAVGALGTASQSGFAQMASSALSVIAVIYEIGTTLQSIIPTFGDFGNVKQIKNLLQLQDYVKSLGLTADEFKQKVEEAGLSLEQLSRDVHDPKAFAADLEILKKGLDEAKQKADALAEAMHAGGARSNTELQHAADLAREAFEKALKSEDYSQANLDKLYLSYQQSLAALPGPAGEAAQAWLKAHDAIAGTAQAIDTALQKLIDRRDALNTAISQEAPEEQIGVIEQQMRTERDAIEQQIKNAQKAADATADAQSDAAHITEERWGDTSKILQEHLEDAGDQAADHIRDAFDFTIHIPIVFDVPALPSFPPLPVVPQATGGDWLVRKPTLFLAGEKGAERATFSPVGQSSGTGGGDVVAEIRALRMAILAQPTVVSISGREIIRATHYEYDHNVAGARTDLQELAGNT